MTSPATCFPFGRCWGCEERVGGLCGGGGVGGEKKSEGRGIWTAKRRAASREGSQWGLLSTESSPMCHQLTAAPWEYIRYVILFFFFPSKEQLQKWSVSPPSGPRKTWSPAWVTSAADILSALADYIPARTTWKGKQNIWIWPRMLTWINKSMVVQSPGELQP